MSQTMENEEMEMEATQATQTAESFWTRAPKAEAKGTKPAGWAIQFPNPFLGNLQELCEKYSEETVLDCARAQLRVKFQSTIRSLAEAGKSDEEITNTMSTWKPGDKLGLGADPKSLIMRNFGNLTPEQKALLMQELAAMTGKM